MRRDLHIECATATLNKLPSQRVVYAGVRSSCFMVQLRGAPPKSALASLSMFRPKRSLS